MTMGLFCAADILLPKNVDFQKWAVIACDQFSADPEYWKRVEKFTEDAPSALQMILPEAFLEEANRRIPRINAVMEQFLLEERFCLYPASYIYLERTLANGTVRQGIVGAVDLQAYDYLPGSSSPVRATEQTVLERIPPRKQIRKDAPLEFPHVLMLCDDEKKGLIEPLSSEKQDMMLLYDLDLMENGGHLTGWLLNRRQCKEFDDRFDFYCTEVSSRFADLNKPGVILAVGDGNHSLATAKSCYEDWREANSGGDSASHPSRYALVELENIHSPALQFEPIHRVVFRTDTEKMLQALQQLQTPDGCAVEYITEHSHGVLHLDAPSGTLAVQVLQRFLDQWLEEHSGTIDYIHGEDEVCRLASQPNAIGFLLPAMGKEQLFLGVTSGGVLPRKTFSMGHAREKRYYMEGRKIK